METASNFAIGFCSNGYSGILEGYLAAQPVDRCRCLILTDLLRKLLYGIFKELLDSEGVQTSDRRAVGSGIMAQTSNLAFERVEHLSIKQMAEAVVDRGDFERTLLPGVEEVVFARSGCVELGEVASILIKHQFPRVFRIVEDIGLSKEVSSRQVGGGRV